MNQDIKEQAYILSLKGATEREIAKELNLSPATVHRAISSVTTSHDYQLAIMSISLFLEDMRRAADFWKMQNREIEQIKNSVMALREEVDSKGRPLVRGDRILELVLKCMDMQSDRMQKVVELARQGEVALALREVRKTMTDAEAQRFRVIKQDLITDANAKLEEKQLKEEGAGQNGQP